MKIRIAVLMTLLVCGRVPAELVVVQHVNVVDVARGAVEPSQTIAIDAGRIIAVQPDGELRAPPGARVIDATGKYAIPGLWDMHVHFSHAAEFFFPVFVANGVTHVREMGGPYDDVYRLRTEVASGTRLGPQIFAAGPILESARWVERASGFLPAEQLAARFPVASAEDARRAVDEVFEGGADFIKFRTVESRDAYFAIAERGRLHGLPFVGHAPPPAISLTEAALAGQRSIEHYIKIVGVQPLPEDLDAVSRIFRDAGTHFVPTLVSAVGFRLVPDDRLEAVIADTSGAIDPRRRYVPATLIDSWQIQFDMKRSERVKLDYEKIHAENLALFARLRDAGVPLMAGTDLTGPLVYPGFSLHDELAMFVDELGMSPGEALAAATVVPAKFIGADEYGRIKSGTPADFILLERDPLADIRNTQSIWAVSTGTRFLTRGDLDGLLADAAATAGNH